VLNFNGAGHFIVSERLQIQGYFINFLILLIKH